MEFQTLSESHSIWKHNYFFMYTCALHRTTIISQRSRYVNKYISDSNSILLVSLFWTVMVQSKPSTSYQVVIYQNMP